MELFIIISIIVFFVLWGIAEIVFYVKHKHPLSEVEIEKLSKKRRRKHIATAYNFKHYDITVNKQFKSSMSTAGKLYTIDEDLHTFPSTAAALLKSKKHEWILLALAADNKVIYLWMNKGFDNKSVSYFCSLDTIITKMKRVEACTILCFHNHPNGVLGASSQDMKSAREIAVKTNAMGINLIEFVCATGRWHQYFKSISPTFLPKSAQLHNIRQENGLSEKSNYKLHREIGLIFR